MPFRVVASGEPEQSDQGLPAAERGTSEGRKPAAELAESAAPPVFIAAKNRMIRVAHRSEDSQLRRAILLERAVAVEMVR